MLLVDLDNKNVVPSVVLLQTNSTKMLMFFQDKLKYKFGCKSESVIVVETKSDLKRVREVVGVLPPFAERWYVELNLDKIPLKEVLGVLRVSTTCIFLCTCSRYIVYKEFKEGLRGVSGVYDYYITYLRRADFIYLYDGFVSKDNRLTKQLFDYVVQSYSSDIDAVFDLLMALNSGVKFKSRKDISDLCGLGGLSIEYYILQLVRGITGSARGLSTVLRNRIKVGIDLGETMGYPVLYSAMSRSVGLFSQLKMLVMSGVVYKRVRGLPKSFDERALSRYQRYLGRLSVIPLSSFIKIRQAMGDKVWRDELDFLNFVYRYYDSEAKLHLLSGGMSDGDLHKS